MGACLVRIEIVTIASKAAWRSWCFVILLDKGKNLEIIDAFAGMQLVHIYIKFTPVKLLF